MTVYGIDFFCGIGGATKGFQRSGIEVLKGIDNDAFCKETFEKNCVPAQFICKNISDLSPDDALLNVTLKEGDYLLYIACAPCQPFSSFAQLRSRRNLDQRTYLMKRFLEIVERRRPDFVFVENVPGFTKALDGSLFAEFCGVFDDLGYNYEWRNVDAKDYGIPQKRLRLIFLASGISKVTFFEPKYGKGRSPYRTVRDAIGKYPAIKTGETHPTVPNHQCQKLSRLNLKRLKCTPKNGGYRKDWPSNLWLKCHKKGSGHTDVYGRMKWDEPAPTLTCRCISLSNGRFAHPEQNRAISVREAAALQTFSDDFIFYESMTAAAEHIGNAVPSLLAFQFGKMVVDMIKQKKIAT